MAILLMPLAFGGLAQNPFSINTDINTAGKTLKQVITEIENRYDVSFSYSDNLLPKRHLNRIDNGKNLGQFLENLLYQHNIGYDSCSEASFYQTAILLIHTLPPLDFSLQKTDLHSLIYQ